MRGKPWTPAQIDELRWLWPDNSTEDVARILGHSKGSCIRKACGLKLKRTDPYKFRKYNHLNKWTEFQIDQLRQFWPVMDSEVVAGIIGRSKFGCSVKASELGIHKSPEFLAVQYDIMKLAQKDRHAARLNVKDGMIQDAKPLKLEVRRCISGGVIEISGNVITHRMGE